jgi:hypothetical protein
MGCRRDAARNRRDLFGDTVRSPARARPTFEQPLEPFSTPSRRQLPRAHARAPHDRPCPGGTCGLRSGPLRVVLFQIGEQRAIFLAFTGSFGVSNPACAAGPNRGGDVRIDRRERTTLYELVRDNLETLYGAVDDGALDMAATTKADAINRLRRLRSTNERQRPHAYGDLVDGHHCTGEQIGLA